MTCQEDDDRVLRTVLDAAGDLIEDQLDILPVDIGPMKHVRDTLLARGVEPATMKELADLISVVFRILEAAPLVILYPERQHVDLAPLHRGRVVDFDDS